MPSTINAKNTSTGVVITPDASGQLELQTADTTRMTIDVNGNVGIGTSSPDTKLQVSGTSGSPQFQAGTDVNGYFQINAFDSNPVYCVIAGANATAGVFGTQANIPTIFFTNNTERMRIDSSGYVTNAVNGLGNGRLQAYQYYRLNSGLAGANVNTAQSIFGVGVTLVGSTVYEFEIAFALSKSAGTTSHNITLSFGGTATLNNIGFFISGQGGAGSSNQVGSFNNGTINGIGFATSSSIQVVTACVTASNGLPYLLKGTVSVANGGTFIPQYTLSAAPGGAYTVQAGSYIKISPLSASGSNTSIGSWA